MVLWVWKLDHKEVYGPIIQQPGKIQASEVNVTLALLKEKNKSNVLP